MRALRIIGFFLIGLASCEIEWKPQDLYYAWHNRTPSMRSVVDMDGVISNEMESSIREKIAMNFPEIDIYFFMCNRISSNYLDPQTKKLNIKKFVKDLDAMLFTKENEQIKSLVFVFVVKDDLKDFKDGFAAQLILPKETVQASIDKATPFFDQKDYDNAFKTIVDSLISDRKHPERVLYLVIALVGVITLLIVYYCMKRGCCRSKRYRRKKLKNKTSNNNDNKGIVNGNDLSLALNSEPKKP